MPRKTDTISIKDTFLKRSSKLLPCQKEMVIFWHNKGLGSKKIASIFRVSKRLIQFIIDPQKHKNNIERRQERGGSSQYYDREYHTKKTKEHREYKKQLFNPSNLKP